MSSDLSSPSRPADAGVREGGAEGGDERADDAVVSVIVTVRNEAAHIGHLLDSLLPQRHLKEVIVVDAQSDDDTVAVAESYGDRLPMRVVVEPCSRGGGRNIGARIATGRLLAFTDGDCRVNARWLEELVAAWDGEPRRVVAGQTLLEGFWAFCDLHRVELPHKGQDTTWPTSNLAYPARLFGDLGGFDEDFVTAEDIDLNYRAVSAGATIMSVPQAIVYAQARDSVRGFVRQAYWNGYGRKQLTRKHGRLWRQYRFVDMVRLQGDSFWGLLRMAAGLFGYLGAKMGRRPGHPAPPAGQRGGDGT